MLPITAIGTVAAIAWSRSLDALLSGETEASALGVDTVLAKRCCIGWCALLSAGAVCVGGNVMFVGLIVPHALRPLLGVAHGALVPASALMGGAFLVLCDVLCRLAPAGGELPLGVITGLVGAPLFFVLLVAEHAPWLSGSAPIQAAPLAVELAGRRVLDGVSLHFAAGEVTAILGPNGAGKSTLLWALGELLPYAGEVRYGGGRQPRRFRPRERALRVAYVPQHTELRAPLCVRDVVALGRFAHGARLGRLSGARRARSMPRSRLATSSAFGALVPRLSGGEQRRVLDRARARERGEDCCCPTSRPRGSTCATCSTRIGCCGAWPTRGRAVVVVPRRLSTMRASFADRAVLLAQRPRGGAGRARGGRLAGVRARGLRGPPCTSRAGCVSATPSEAEPC